jgi:NAD(P)-dependent dehydrogenase (short-subunit alcohol dehydrogenase family)
MKTDETGGSADRGPAESFSLAGKTVIVTGGGGALCGAIACGFAQAGASVALWGRGRPSLDETAKMITATPGAGRVATIVADLTDERQIESALRESVSEFGRVDILLNGVGGSSIRRPLVELDREDFESVVRLNLLAGCILPTKHLARHWIEKKTAGAIINIASMGSYIPLSGGWAYSAAKAAVMNQTVAHARELAPHGIRVNAIAPGFFLGKQNRRLLINEDGSPTPRGQSVLAHTPMGRFGSPTDLIGAAVFLASEASSFITGITVPVDGGFLSHGI